MIATNQALTVANDVTLTAMISKAQRRLIIVAPGLSTELAKIVSKLWRHLGADSVSITLDINSEIFRLGLGDIKAVELLTKTASSLKTTLNVHPGLRIGVVIADDETLVYSPTPLLIEASPNGDDRNPTRPNGLRVGLPPADLERDLGAGPEGAKGQTIGLDCADRTSIKEVKEDLESLPPQPFSISRLLRVYTAHLEFVELRLIGCKLNRRTIQIPSDLIGLADENTRKLLESKFRVIDEEDACVWGDEIHRLRNFIVKRFLVHIPSFGYVVRLEDKASLDKALKCLRKKLNQARRRKTESLQAAIDRRTSALESALLPVVKQSPPKRWGEQEQLDDADIANALKAELQSLTGTAEEICAAARVEIRYKGVTFDMLNDPVFITTVKKAMPDLKALHHELVAAPAM